MEKKCDHVWERINEDREFTIFGCCDKCGKHFTEYIKFLERTIALSEAKVKRFGEALKYIASCRDKPCQDKECTCVYDTAWKALNEKEAELISYIKNKEPVDIFIIKDEESKEGVK